MAEVIILHTPEDASAAQAFASTLTRYRVLTVAVTRRDPTFALGPDMTRVVMWSLAASAPRYAPAWNALLGRGDSPFGVVSCDGAQLLPRLERSVAARVSLGANQHAYERMVESLLLRNGMAHRAAASAASRKRPPFHAGFGFGMAAGVATVAGVAGLSSGSFATNDAIAASFFTTPRNEATSLISETQSAYVPAIQDTGDLAIPAAVYQAAAVSMEDAAFEVEPIEFEFETALLLQLKGSPLVSIEPHAQLVDTKYDGEIVTGASSERHLK